jgi:alkylated DNA repair protein alkB family protein 1
MGGHVDDLELAMDKPIVSISLGLPAVFVLGGTTKEEGPVVAILLRPGDVLCMGGPSRLNYHAMARVVPHPAATKLATTTTTTRVNDRQTRHTNNATFFEFDSSIPEEDQVHLDEYLKHHRININVRQVYPDNCDVLL